MISSYCSMCDAEFDYFPQDMICPECEGECEPFMPNEAGIDWNRTGPLLEKRDFGAAAKSVGKGDVEEKWLQLPPAWRGGYPLLSAYLLERPDFQVGGLGRDGWANHYSWKRSKFRLFVTIWPWKEEIGIVRGLYPNEGWEKMLMPTEAEAIAYLRTSPPDEEIGNP